MKQSQIQLKKRKKMRNQAHWSIVVLWTLEVVQALAAVISQPCSGQVGLPRNTVRRRRATRVVPRDGHHERFFLLNLEQ
jgi:predicted NAD/FAD-binding protein